jgi:predicted phage-related endonuclease
MLECSYFVRWSIEAQDEGSYSPVSTSTISTTKVTTAVEITSTTIELPADAEKAIVELNSIRATLKHLEEAEKKVKATLMGYLDGAEEGTIKGIVRLTAKSTTRHGVDAKKLKEVFPEAAEACATETSYIVVKTK